MKYEEIYNKSLGEYLAALRMLKKHTLPSIWSRQGKGWHEQWMSSPNCGVYASCQGLILLNREAGSECASAELNTNIYNNNLLLLFDEEHPIESMELQFKLMTQRGKAIDSTYKISYFLYTTKTINAINPVSDRLSLRLLSMCNFDGYFYVSQNKLLKSFMATALAYRALCYYYDGTNTELDATRDIFVQVIENHDGEDVKKIILALWALSEFPPLELTEKLLESAIRHVLRELDALSPVMEEKFVLSNGMRDGFSIDLHLIFYQSVLQFIFQLKIPLVDNLNNIAYKILDIAVNINKYKIYSPNNNSAQALFWEHYSALRCLKNFCDVVDQNPLFKEKEYMIIDPKYFAQKSFTVEPKTATIIMPFSVDWSDKVYETFCNALPEFRIWRSKEECSADAIMQSVWEHINSSELIIADCTGKNSNVFYELGIAHTLGKKVFMCAQDIKDLPFDINYLRSFLYATTDEGLAKLKHDLQIFTKSV